VSENLTAGVLPLGTICYGVSATLCALGVMELERSGELVVSKTLIFLGDASYSIYLVHQPALSVMAKLGYPLWLRMKVPLIVPFMVMVIGSVGLGVLVHLFLERPLLTLVRRSKGPLDLPVAAASFSS